jgi:hypothetical protein
MPLLQESSGDGKLGHCLRLHVAFFSNKCLSITIVCWIWIRCSAMPKRMLLLTAGTLAAGLVGVVMIVGHWRQAPKPIYTAHAAPEITQLSRDEHDLIAEMIKAQLVPERSQSEKQKLAASATPVRSKATTARPRVDRALSSLRSGRSGWVKLVGVVALG